MHPNKNGVPFQVRLGYGLGSLGEGIGYNVFYSFFIYYLTTVAGIDPAFAGTISMIAVIWDAVTDPLIGTWSDNTKNKMGRRRPFMIFGSLLAGLSLVLMFCNVNLAPGVKNVYYIIINIFFWAAMTSCVIPHISLGTDLTSDYNGRTGVRAYATLMLNTGTLIATSATLMVVNVYSNIFMDTNKAWLFMGLTYAVLIILAYQVSCFTLRGKEPPNPNLTGAAKQSKIHVGRILSEYRRAFRNTSLRVLLIVTFITNFVVGVASSLTVFVFTYLYGYSEAQSSAMFLYQGVLCVALVAVITFVSVRIGKKKTLLCGQLVYSLGYLIMLFFPATGATLVACLSLAALGNVAYWTIIYSMTYDATLIEEFRSGENPTGLYVSMIGLLMKIGTSVGMFIVGIGLDLVGFDSNAVQQTAEALSGLKMLYSILPGAMLLIGALVASRYRLTEEKYHALLAAKECKERGDAYDEAGISGLL